LEFSVSSDTDLAFRATLDGSGFASGMQGINGHLNDLGFRTNAATAGLGSLGTVLGTLANPMTIAAAAAMALGTALAASVQAAASWQTSMTGVAKTTGMAGPELAALSKELLDLSANMPIAASELASIAQAGGSLGIAKEELAGFTEVAAQMGVGFEMAADKAATSGAKILNAFGQEMNTENLRSLGSVVNAMGDSFAATEPQVLDFLNRASFLNATMGQNIQQVAALGTTLISTGLDAEVAATGIKSALNMLTSETSKKGGMDNWAKLMGVSVDELKEKIATDLNSALIETANQIVAIEDPVERFQAAVAAAGTEGAPAILKLAGQQENYAKALGLTNDEWEKATSLQKTFDAQASTANSQWQIFLNTLNMAAVELGTIMLPAISETLTFMSDLVKVSIRVGEELYNIGVKAWDALAPLRELWKYTPSGVASNLEGQIWGGIKNWAGIGTEHAETMAKEISENENLQKAGEEAIKAGQDAGVFAAKTAGSEAGTEAGDAYAEAMAGAISRQSADVSLAQAKMYEEGIAALKAAGLSGVLITGTGDAYEDQIVREFDYLGKRIQFIAKEEIGKCYLGDFYQYKVMVDGATFDTGRLLNYSMSPVEAFEAATGLPAPEEGTAAYYRLMGDEIAAARIDLQKELSSESTFEIKSLGWSSFSGEYEGAQEIADEFEKSLKEINWESLPGVIESGENLKKVILDSSSSALAAEPFLGLVDEQISKYQAALVAGVADSAKIMESEMNRLGELSKDAFSDGFLSESERGTLLGLEPELQLLKATFPAEFEKAGGDAILAMIEAIKAGDLPGALALIGKEAGEEFAQNLLGAAALVPQSLAELIADPNALKSAAVDQDRFWQGTVLPTIKDNAEDAKKAFDSGQFTTEQIYENYIKPMSQLTDYMPGWVDEINSMFKSGAIDIDDYIYILDGMTKKASDTVEKTNAQTKAVQDQAIGYDNLKKAMEDCSECAVSEFGQWQEAQDGLFQDSYIGPGGQGYLDWKNQQIAAIAETQAAMRAMGGVSVGQQYEMPEAQIKIGADTSPAETAKSNLEANIESSKPDMTLGIETQAAMDEVTQLVTYIITVNPTMSVQVSVSAYAGEIQAIVADAIRSALA
jgi:TP901 family phage tail tape measure protein